MSQTKLESMLNEHQQAVYRLAYYMLSDAEDAKDVAQEAFIRAWKKVRKIRSETARNWLLRTTHNLCIDRLRRRKFQGEWPEEAEAVFVADIPGPLETCLSHETRQLVREAIARLPLNLRTPVVLRDLEGLSYDEIAEMLSEPLGTVKSNICRGRRLLRKQLQPLLIESGEPC